MQNMDGSFRRQGLTRNAFKICSVCCENSAGTKQLQVMLTKRESLKGNAQEGMPGNYFEKKIMLKIK